MLEVVTMPEELVLAEWVWEWHAAGEVEKVVDARLGDKFNAGEAAAVWCSHPAQTKQPPM